MKNGVLKEKADAKDLITNEMIDDINKFDRAEVVKLAKEYRTN